MTTTDFDMYSTDLDVLIPDLPSFEGGYTTPISDLPMKARRHEHHDQLVLLALRECFADYGNAVTTDEDQERLVAEAEQILELDPDSTVDRPKINRALERFRSEHLPNRRDPESMEAAWCLIYTANKKLHERLVGEYSTTSFLLNSSRRQLRQVS